MKMPPTEQETRNSPRSVGPTCKCGSELVRNDVWLRESAGSYKRIAVFRFCIKCGYASRWMRCIGRETIEPQLWERLRKLGNYTVEHSPDGSLRPWVNEFMLTSELGQEILKKQGLNTEEFDSSVYVPGCDSSEIASKRSDASEEKR
jgi:hypothetical protein